MSDLQLSLIGMGALLVVGVIGYNKWQERKYRTQMARAFNTEQADVLMPPVADDVDTPAWAREVSREADDAPDADVLPQADAPVQPVFTPAPEASVPGERREPTLADPRAEPAAEEPAAMPEAAIPPPAPAPLIEAQNTMPAAPDVSQTPPSTAAADASKLPPADWCDSSIDALARLDFDEPVSKDELVLAHHAMQAQLRLPLRAYVQLVSGSWQALKDVTGGEFQTLCLALQLVDRHGPVTKAELDSLHKSVLGLCNLRQGHAVLPNMAEAAEQARALDEFCAQLDLQLALNVLDTGKGAFAGTKLRGLAEAAGMQLADSGEFHAFDEAGNFLFAMANMGEGFNAENLRTLQTHGLTFFLDVPHVLDGGFAFERMLATARQCANALGGNLVNAQRAPVNDSMVDGIRKKILEIHEQMQIAGIPSGGPRALRLFS